MPQVRSPSPKTFNRNTEYLVLGPEAQSLDIRVRGHQYRQELTVTWRSSCLVVVGVCILMGAVSPSSFSDGGGGGGGGGGGDGQRRTDGIYSQKASFEFGVPRSILCSDLLAWG
ncbi:hypothetical protein C8R48DRAFT_668427 [Suillus tomentosus]|nr:hypothetical protein C8R48DRAFT_668427 [Suillus tomentosus]